MRHLVSVCTALAVVFMVGCGPSCKRGSEEVHCSECCRVCDSGKACGDSCISKSSNCNQGEGCACDKL